MPICSLFWLNWLTGLNKSNLLCQGMLEKNLKDLDHVGPLDMVTTFVISVAI